MPSSDRLRAAAAAVLLCAACGGGDGASVPSEAFDLAGRNLLLISVDTLRADHISPYGYDLETPAMQRLADEGVVFEDAQTPVPLTQPSHTSLFTGLYPGRTGIRDNAGSTLTNDAVTLAETLRDAGYQTSAVIASRVLQRAKGLDQGFEHYDDHFSASELETLAPNIERRAREVRISAQKWLAGRDRERPFALFVHFFDAHMPHDPPPLFRERHPGKPLDGEIAFVDRNIEELLDGLEAEGELERTLVVLFGDHGESLGEHAEEEHGLFLYESTSHVPLIVRLPGAQAPRGVRVATPVSLVDVMPTVLELLELPAPPADGVSLVPLLAGGEIAPRPILSETHYPLFFGWAPSYGLRDDGWKFILSPKPELYDLTRDPRELENLIEREPARAAGMRVALERQIGIWDETSGTAEAGGTLSMAELAALGYSSGVAIDASEGGELPDMKDRTELYTEISEALDLMSSEDWEGARVRLERALEKEPTNPSSLLNMGSVLAHLGKVDEAELHLKAVLSLQPDNLHAKGTLAMNYLAAQRFDDAEAMFRDMLEQSPRSPEPRFYLGQVLAMRGDFEGALECFEEVQRLQPNMPMLGESLNGARRMLQERGATPPPAGG